MKTLYINTCTNELILKLFKKNKVYKEITLTHDKSASQILMPSIKKLLEDEEINNIIVVNGPGSFTGIRLGITVAKTFSYVKKIPIRTITTLEELAVSLNTDKKIVALEENNGYFVGIFDYDNNLVGEYQYLSNTEFDEFNKKYDISLNVELDYEKIYDYVMNKEKMNPHFVNPLYIKKLDYE